MIDLDDVNEVRKIDKADQLSIMEKWGDLIFEARTNALKIRIKTYKWQGTEINYQKPSSIVICGMGGSAIVGDYLISLVYDKLTIPVILNKDYSIPNFVGNNTLVICVSYSGNTEETISCYYQALMRKAMLVTISSGGIIEELSSKIGNIHIKVKPGQPPRTALPLTYISILTILEKMDIISNIEEQILESEKIIRKLSYELGPETSFNDNIAKQTALELYSKLPIFIGGGYFAPVSYRAKCQLNENSKQLAVSETIPENNHNGIVVWDSNKVLNHVVIIFLRDHDLSPSLSLRMKVLKDIASNKTQNIIDLYALGKSPLAKQLSLTYIIDYISIYLAILYEIDPSITPSIDALKKSLSETSLRDNIVNEILKLLENGNTYQ